jgi:hypothetical protein
MLWLTGICSMLWAGGCSWMIRPPVDDMAARRMVDAAAAHNGDLKRYKGLARVRVEYEGRKMTGRVALAAQAPDRMRVEWLTSLGQPLTSLAGNGKTLSVVSYSTRKFYRFRQSADALKTVVHIPLGIDELFDILSGRPPLPVFAAAGLDRQEERPDGVSLKNRWHGVVARLGIDPESGLVETMKTYDGAGSWRYRVIWKTWMSRGAYTLPASVEIATPAGERLVLDMERFWPDAELDPAMFDLVAPWAQAGNRQPRTTND